jgi:hypothetical protein
MLTPFARCAKSVATEVLDCDPAESDETRVVVA